MQTYLPPLNGLLLVDKPKGITSTAVLSRVKRRLQQEKAGHGGTLDPLATGLLPIFFGSWTKLSNYCLSDDKTYRAIIQLGKQTDSGDSQGVVIHEADVPPLTKEGLDALALSMHGEIEQIPPAFSAIKVKGTPSYTHARNARKTGIPMAELPPRQVHIYKLEMRLLDARHIDFKVHCSKGTYVRSLGEQIAERLSTCGHLCALRRTGVGSLRVTDAVASDHARASGKGWIEFEQLLPDMPRIEIDYAQQEKLVKGQALELADTANYATIAALSQDGEVVAMCEQQGTQLLPKRVLLTG